MAADWAIDFGTTNSVVSVAEGGSVRVVHFPELGRTLPAEHRPLIPTAVHLAEELMPFLWLFRRKQVRTYIGQQAIGRNYDGRSPTFAQSFKPRLASEPHRTLMQIRSRDVTVRDVCRLFLGELLKYAAKEGGEKVTSLTIPAPVGYYEQYRAELMSVARELGMKRFRSIDEPVAAGLGYGVNVSRDENLLVVDFGGGTLNLAAVRLGPGTTQTGAAPVLAKHMVSMGGDDVDRWVMEKFIPRKLLEFPDWHLDAKWEAMFAKEQASREGKAEFRWGGFQSEFTRQDLESLLEKRGLFGQLRTALMDIKRQLAEDPRGGTIDQVLLTGGSTQLPGIPAVVDDAFPEAVVRHDRDYVKTSVALGSARFAGGVAVDDFIYHDYAVAVHNDKANPPRVDYELLVSRRTRYPTAPNFAVRYYGDYKGMTDVSICVVEVGRLGQEPVRWDEAVNGQRYWTPVSEKDKSLAVTLNPGDERIALRPTGVGTSPRLRVNYRINADRWLCTTVEDLVRKQTLIDDQPVVRLR